MRRIWITCLWLLIAINFAYAQDEGIIDTVRVASQVPDIVAILQLNLSAYDISVLEVEKDWNELASAEQDLLIQTDSWWDEEADTEYVEITFRITRFNARQIQSQFNDVSPLLDHSMWFYYKRSDCNEEIVCSPYSEVFVAMSLYAIDRCDLIGEPIQNIRKSSIASGQLTYTADLIEANCAILEQDYSKARSILENSAWLTSVYRLEGVANLAWLYIENSQFEDANNLLDACVEHELDFLSQYELLSPNIILAEAYTLRARVRALTFNYDGAIEDINFAIEELEGTSLSRPSLAPYYTLRGEIIFLIYEWDRVLENFNTALELDPDYAPAYFQRGVLYYTMTERENALADFQHYLEIAPDGEHAAEAQRYIDSIQLELESLGG